jgi:RNA polymerase sigma-70 factor (ECF subfamily)
MLQRFVGTQSTAPYLSEKAFASLYEAQHRSVFRYAYGLLGAGQQDAEDITAETFIKAWNARQRFFGTEEQALSWLFTIAKRLVIDRWRRVRAIAEEISIDSLPIADDSSPEERTLILEQSAILMKILVAMEEEKREIIVLRYLLGWSVNRIADYLGKSPNAISQSIRRSLQSLRDDWPEQD